MASSPLKQATPSTLHSTTHANIHNANSGSGTTPPNQGIGTGTGTVSASAAQHGNTHTTQHYSLGHGPTQASVSNSVASLSSTIAASGLVLLPPPPLTSKNLTIHTSLLSTKQQLLQQQQQLQQLHHAQLNAALKKQQQQQQQQLQQKQQQPQLQQQTDGLYVTLPQHQRQQLSANDCPNNNGAQSDDTVGESPPSATRGLLLGSQPTSQSTTRVTSPVPGTTQFHFNSGQSVGSTSPVSDTPGVISSLLGGHSIDHYPPPDQWNYTMTRYHASLIPLCQIEEPPSFYEGMDDSPLDHNDDTSPEPIDDDDKNNNNNNNNKDKDNSDFAASQGLGLGLGLGLGIGGRGRGFGLGLGARGRSDRASESEAKTHRQHCNKPPQQSHQPPLLQHSQLDQPNLTLEPQPQQPPLQQQLQPPSPISHPHRRDTSEQLDHETTKLHRQQRRRERTLGSSGEQVFFYDGPTLLHAKLYSGRDKSKSETFSDSMEALSSTKVFSSGTGPEGGRSAPTVSGTPSSSPRVFDASIPGIPSSTPLAVSKIHSPQSQSPPRCSRSQSRSSFRSTSRSRSRSASCHSFIQLTRSSRSRSGSRPRSETWSRTKSDSFARVEAVSSSAPLTRPNMLYRGLSVDSNTQLQQQDTKSDKGLLQGFKSRNGSEALAGGTIGRKMKAKDRLVSLIKRSTLTSNTTNPPFSVVNVESGNSQESLPQSIAHPNSIDERVSICPGPSPDLTLTRNSRRQPSPALSRSGTHGCSASGGNERSAAVASVSAYPMMGFPYNNSSLLMSTDLNRAVPSKSPLAVKTARSSKPRPVSVATMEKLMSSQDMPKHGSNRSPRAQRDHVPLERHDSGVEHSPDHQYRRLHRPVTEYGEDLLQSPNSRGQSSGHGRSTMTASGSHPLLSAFDPVLPYVADDRALKGKGLERRERERLLVTSPVQEDVDMDVTDGPVRVLEHHIHHHYYCQHCPPIVSDDMKVWQQQQQQQHQTVVDIDNHYSTVGQRHRPDSSPILSMFQHTKQHQQRRHVQDMFDTSPQKPPVTSEDTPLVVPNKKKSILGTMTVKSTTRKRFFAEQKQQESAATPISEKSMQKRRGSQQTDQNSPLSSLILSDYEKDTAGSNDDGPISRFMSRHRGHVGPYGPAGATIRVTKRHQNRILLDGLTDEELDNEEDGGEGNTTMDSSQDPDRVLPSQADGNQRAKFLSRLKRFLLRPSPFANKNGAGAGTERGEAATAGVVGSAQVPWKPTEAATVRISKTRWTRSGNNLPDLGRSTSHQHHYHHTHRHHHHQHGHCHQDFKGKERHMSDGQLVSYPSQREESRMCWMSPDIYEEPSSTTTTPPSTVPTPQHKRDIVDIRTQFQQSAPSPPTRPAATILEEKQQQ